jgi:hypothetical protein
VDALRTCPAVPDDDDGGAWSQMSETSPSLPSILIANAASAV